MKKIIVTVIAGLLASSAFAAPLSTDRATEIAQDSKCFKCHGVDKAKDGPAWKKVASDYKTDAWKAKHPKGAKATLVHHITSGEEVKFEDGHTEEHKKIKTSGDAETSDFADWLLSL